MNTCPICGKLTVIHWPDMYTYKRGPVYYCSWQCMDISICRDTAMIRHRVLKRRQNKVKQVMSAEQKKEAVRIAMEGGDPLEYVKKCGSTNPEKLWSHIRGTLKQKDPETYAKLPDRRENRKEETKKAEKVELVYDPDIAEEYRREQEQKKANEKAERDEILRVAEEDEKKRWDLWHTSAVWNEELGEFYYDRKYRTIDWRHPAGEEISIPVGDWRKLFNVIPQIIHVLGADE